MYTSPIATASLTVGSQAFIAGSKTAPHAAGHLRAYGMKIHLRLHFACSGTSLRFTIPHSSGMMFLRTLAIATAKSKGIQGPLARLAILPGGGLEFLWDLEPWTAVGLPALHSA